MTTVEILQRAFSALTAEELANLRDHYDRGTPLLCGEKAHFYADGEGGG